MNTLKRLQKWGVTLIDYDREAEINIAAAFLFNHSNQSLKDLKEYCKSLSEEDLDRILERDAALVKQDDISLLGG